MADTSSLGLLQLLSGGNNNLATQTSLINQPTQEDVQAQGLSGVAASLPSNSLGAGLAKGLLTGVALKKQSSAAGKRDQQTAQLLQQLQAAQARSDYADQLKEYLGTLDAANKEAIGAGPQLTVGIEDWKSTGDSSNLAATVKALPASQDIMRRWANAPQGSTFQGFARDDSGSDPTLHPVFQLPNGDKMVAPQGFTYSQLSQQYGKPYADAKAITQLDAQLKTADVANKEADTVSKLATAKKNEASADGITPAKPLAPSAIKQQNEELDQLATANNISADVGSVIKAIDAGNIHLGPVKNLVNRLDNATGNSTPGSRNYASFRATLEKMRNDSLRLNKGVQTEGDATRAWNELFANLNDTAVVKQRLQEIQGINERAAEQRKLNIDNLRANYNQPPLDYSKYEQGSPILKASQPEQPQQGSMVDSLPQGSQQIGTSGGKPVYRTPDGKTFMGQ
ncbi:hypothetical protein [Mesorhizobium sp. M8A.F.Ca.ET.165.01.1.1]|uniref:hypothetical protein n=1 Tax=Mesorhizobium sp. M8A.F.Ca.ET.165.01.1.1 TaxID=2563960 RepID=UPI001093AE46|nr:hypothetical protein [Mesorhizobium sp. M8A.F.Ca.ET.165.01.1.1]TGT42783.1 hypothetical protein EN808_12945 [Mesorhizobium sp. M8A.F.Ca.ET.165.01.1.1]